MLKRCLRPFCLALLTLSLLFCSLNARAWHTHQPIRFTGDIFAYAGPITVLAGTLALRDYEGAKQLTYSFVTESATIQWIKYLTGPTALGVRPNGGEFSFPSGHSGSVCSIATFVGQRYGWRFGLPMAALAAFTMYSRVHADMHHWYDTVIGCSIGSLSSLYFTSPYHEKDLHIQPWFTIDSIGLSIRSTW